MPPSRYLRQIKLLGNNANSKLQQLTVGIVGCGGLGSNSAALCAQIGVKRLILMDRDRVSRTDFSRQQYFEQDLGKPKVEALKDRIARINPETRVDVQFDQFGTTSSPLFETANIILDGTDNYSARVLINRFSLKKRIPWVFASALKFEGMLSTILPGKSACFECWAKKPINELSCEDSGIMNTAVGVISALQVQELVSLACFNGPNYLDNLIRVDLSRGLFEKIALVRETDCKACSKTR
ncbi:MAG: HesA/MoeB/ThiF family protein [Candidatus Micrarchaeota archaeon]